MDSLKTIKDTAAKWIARRGGEDWSAADESELNQWLNASTGNLIAYTRVEAAWREADRLKVLGAGFPPGYVPDLEDFRASPFFKHVAKDSAVMPARQFRDEIPTLAPRKHWAIAASILILFAGSFLAWMFWPGGAAYSTPVGVTAAVPLSDGSKITLNTNSEIHVTVNDQARKVELERGEAFFEVVPDPLRPFIVSAGNKQILVLGTKFLVKRDRNDVRVVVTEGKVTVSPASASSSADSVLLTAGAIVEAKGKKLVVRERSLSEAEELLSWRSGYVIFHETSLIDAVTEFNRYNTRKFIIEDPAVAAISISGNFRSTNVDSFVRILEDGFPIAVERRGERIILTAR